MPPPRPIILILGPTAGGKTRLAIDLARTLPLCDTQSQTSGGGGECICADSMQVYRGMDIGTAKPTPAEQSEARHHLLDIADPAQPEGFSVDTWLALAEQTIDDIRARGKYPIVVGGTNLYIQALLEGLFDGPAPDPEIRARLQELRNDELRQQLVAIDPVAAERIHLNDRKRTIRAIEVFEATGKPISIHQQQWRHGQFATSLLPNDQSPATDVGVSTFRRLDVCMIGLEWPVELINRRINARVKKMLDDGLVAEVRHLWEDNQLGPQAREALGYKQIISHLEGKCSLDEAFEQIKIRTRRYAKQQRTWLRRFRLHPRSIWLPAGEIGPEELASKARAFIRDSSADSQPYTLPIS